jgi:2-iminobutanoate/2-iminopropanoate deaminase
MRKAVLEAGGTSIANVVRVGVYLRSMDDFGVFNGVFKELLPGRSAGPHDRRGRSPRKGVTVEVDAMAWVP